ncbi:MAG TPA: RecQ family ATP-dependent DNA helicase, partial [Herpetosiphonaceae bacterium]|nr:RecQ family ATP-dependent DNA helicase [Herpetosiphonaceae bacterium]
MSGRFAELREKVEHPAPATVDASPNPLLALTPALLHHVGGKDRTDLLQYLRRWDEHATSLRYLDVWLAAQPGLATLRQARAEALIALDQPAAALPEVDALDRERGATAGRHQLRVRALIAARDWPALEELLAPIGPNDRGDILMAQGDFVEAKQAYAEATALHEGPPSIRDVRAALACGEATRAQALLAERASARGEARPAIAELRLIGEVCAAAGDHAGLTAASVELDLWEATERAELIARLGLGAHEELEVVPDVPATGSDDVILPPEAHMLLHQYWGYDDFRGGQAATITRVLQGAPALAVLPTGAGKSLTYQLPALLLEGATVVVSPLIALMKDQLDGLPPTVRGQATAINSSMSASEVAQRLRDVADGRYRLVYVAPERLRQQAFVQALRSAGIARFVVDEAHCVSLWGLSFRPDYLFLRRVIEELGGPPVLALTATATPETRAEIVEQLGEMELVAASVFRPNLHFSVVQVPNAEAKTVALVEQCSAVDGPILVYARSRERCEELAHLLRRKGIAAGHYHAQVEDRGQAQEAFMRGDVRVLVATVAFGMGVDKPDIRAIIHYNLPQSVEAYYQEAGRAGRDGQPSRCVLLYTSGDKGQLTSWLRQDALDREDLRAVYRVLRDRATRGYTRLPIETLCRDVPQLEETQIRVALGMLERVGLLLRHFDLPRSMRVTLMEPGEDALLREVVAAAGLQPRLTQEIDPVAVAAALGARPDELEAALLRLSNT